MLTATESRLLRVLIALRDATGAKTRTPVAESSVIELLQDDPDAAGSVPAVLDDLERQGFAQITMSGGVREVQMTAPGKIKAAEYDGLRARAIVPPAPTARASARPAAPSTPTVSADWRNDVTDVLDAATQAVPLLPEDSAVVVRALLEDARDAVDDDTRPRARRALTALGGYLGDPASGSLANVLAAQMVAQAGRLAD
ncbi:hypothetical protein [Microbacterium candidum]|uniref:Uncharacterized protein n=1 Tax=Microbacterium candidum TaxID=3041922 RepID=A0ABT7MU15_9MICO|nr:hypothetical protein [Microbacterium sp. ASV49]MDL9977939.1 hypothetical protein [Microbacterium sp. ASV49]